MSNFIDNMRFYNVSRVVPAEAQKTITGGRLSGMTDINPMWRLAKLTEIFGPVGLGWAYEIVDKRVEDGIGGEKVAIVDISLYYRDPASNEWSRPIPGTGGAMLIAKEKAGLRTDDEAYKKALTDAISVACKAIGIGANVYWAAGTSKYTSPVPAATPCSKCGKIIVPYTSPKTGQTYTVAQIIAKSAQKYDGKAVCLHCMAADKRAAEATREVVPVAIAECAKVSEVTGHAPSGETYTCSDCGLPVEDAVYGGVTYRAEDVAVGAIRTYNRVLCAHCMDKLRVAAKEASK